MIYTITLNPAFDKTVQCVNFKAGALNRVLKAQEDIGGKGINVSKIIRLLGGESTALGFVGEIRSQEFLDYLDSIGIKHDFLFISNQVTRTNLKVIDKENQSLTEINEPGFSLSLQNEEELLDKVCMHLNAEDFVVISGSLPKQASPDLYITLFKYIQKKTKKICLDISGDNLKTLIEMKPFFIKPNLMELEQLLGREIDTEEKLFAAAELLLQKGVKHLLVSLGEKGSYYFSENNRIKIHPLTVDVISPVGAGDSQVAAFTFGHAQKYTIDEILRLAAGVSTAMVTTSGTNIPELELINHLTEKVSLEYR